MVDSTAVSTYDQIVNAIREAQQINDLLRTHREELPFDEIANMQQSVADYIQAASRLLLEEDPTQLNNFWFELLAFIDTDSLVIREVLLKLLGKSGNYGDEILLSAIQLTTCFLPEAKDGAFGYEKTVIVALEELYVAGFRYITGVNPSDDLVQPGEIWKHMQVAKTWILQQGLSWQSLSDFTRASARSFQITLIQLQTYGPSNIDSAQPSLGDMRHDISWPNDISLNRQQLLKEAEAEIETLLSHSWIDNSLQYTMMTMNMVSRLAKTRPQYLPQIIQWYELMHATMPTDALSQLEAESVVRLMRYQLLHFISILSSLGANDSAANFDRISVLLYDCGADDSQIRRYSTEAQRQQRNSAANGGARMRQNERADEDDALVSRRKPSQTLESTEDGLSLRDEGEKYEALSRANVADDDNDDEDEATKTAAAADAAAGGSRKMMVEDQFGLQYDLSEPKSAAINFTTRRLADMLSLERALELVMKFERDVPDRSPEAFLSHHFVMRHDGTDESVEKQKQHLARVLAARMEAEGVGPGGGFVRQKLYELQQVAAADGTATLPADADMTADKNTTDTSASLTAQGANRIDTIGGIKTTVIPDVDERKSTSAAKFSSLLSSSLDDEPEPPPSQDYKPSERAFNLNAITTEFKKPAEVEKFRLELIKQIFAKPDSGSAQFSRILFADAYWIVRKSYSFLAARFGGSIRSGTIKFFEYNSNSFFSPAQQRIFFTFRTELCDFIQTNPRQCQSLMLQWLSTEYLIVSGRYDDRLKWRSLPNEPERRASFCNAYRVIFDVLFSTFSHSPPNPTSPIEKNNVNEQQLFASDADHQQFIIDLLSRVVSIPDEAVKMLSVQMFVNLASVQPAAVVANVVVELGKKLIATTAAGEQQQVNENTNSEVNSSSTNNAESNDKLRLFHFFMRLFKTLALSRAPQDCQRYVSAFVEPLYVQRLDIQRTCLTEIIALHQFCVKSSFSAMNTIDNNNGAAPSGLVYVTNAIEKEAVNMLRMLEHEVPAKTLFEPQYLRSLTAAPIPLVGTAPDTPLTAAAPATAAWNEELVRTCSMLFMKLVPYNVGLMEELGRVFVRARPLVKRDLFKAIEAPIQAVGAHPVLLNFLRTCPVGSEPLITKTLNLLTQNSTEPTPEMISIAWNVYKSRSADVRMLLPVIAGLSKQDIFDCMQDICRLTDAVQKDCFDRLLSNKSNANFTALDVLVALHDVQPKRDVLTFAQLGNTFRHCVEAHADKFTPAIVRRFIELTIDRDSLPPMFMRTLMWAMKVHQQTLLPYIISVLQGIAARGTVWLVPNTWQGYIRCLDLGMALDPKRCARLLIVQLPPAQLQQILLGNVQLRRRLDAAIQQTPSLIDGGSADVRAVIVDPQNGYKAPPAPVAPARPLQQQRSPPVIIPPKQQPVEVLSPKVEQQPPVVLSSSTLLTMSMTSPAVDDEIVLSDEEDFDDSNPSQNFIGIVVGDSKTAEPMRETVSAAVAVQLEKVQPQVYVPSAVQPRQQQPLLAPPLTASDSSPDIVAVKIELPSSPISSTVPPLQAAITSGGGMKQLADNFGNTASSKDVTKPVMNNKVNSLKSSSVDKVIGSILGMPKQHQPATLRQINGSLSSSAQGAEKRKVSITDEDDLATNGRTAKVSKLSVVEEERELDNQAGPHGIPIATAVGVLPVSAREEEQKKKQTTTTIVTSASAMDLGPDLSSDEMVQMNTLSTTNSSRSASSTRSNVSNTVKLPPLTREVVAAAQPAVPATTSSGNSAAGGRQAQPQNIPTTSSRTSSSSSSQKDDNENKPPKTAASALRSDVDPGAHSRPLSKTSVSSERLLTKPMPHLQVAVQEQAPPLVLPPNIVPFTQLAKPKPMATRRRAEEPQPPPQVKHKPVSSTKNDDDSGASGSSYSSDEDTKTKSVKERIRQRRGSDTSHTRATRGSGQLRKVVGTANKNTVVSRKVSAGGRDERPTNVTTSAPRRMETRRTKKD